jgi:hypothetical protein
MHGSMKGDAMHGDAMHGSMKGHAMTHATPGH